ncbi:MAG: hypothetical protein NTX88_06120 [Candidatus Atribacteria bacterium]|nr:hypothetical protein [Candidatus Atribacteria bacterium]
MKKILSIASIVVILIIAMVTIALAQEQWPTVELPIENLASLPKEEIKKEGSSYPGGWQKFYGDYKMKTLHYFSGDQASPFDEVAVLPFTRVFSWVEVLMIQDQNFETDQYAEDLFIKNEYYLNGLLPFHVVLVSSSLSLLDKDQLRFVFQNSTGTKKDANIHDYNLDETKKPIYSAQINLLADLPPNAEKITWFSLHILNKGDTRRVDMSWTFKKETTPPPQ